MIIIKKDRNSFFSSYNASGFNTMPMNPAMPNMPQYQDMNMGTNMMMDNNNYEQRISNLERDMKNYEDRLNRIESMLNTKNNVNEFNYANQMYMV